MMACFFLWLVGNLFGLMEISYVSEMEVYVWAWPLV